MYVYVMSPTELKEKHLHRSFATSRYYARLKAIEAGNNYYVMISPDGSWQSEEFGV